MHISRAPCKPANCSFIICKRVFYRRPIWKSHFETNSSMPPFPAQNLGMTARRPYIHCGHVTVVRLPDLLHHLLFRLRTRLDGALHRNGPLRVVNGQVLQTEQSHCVQRSIFTCGQLNMHVQWYLYECTSGTKKAGGNKVIAFNKPSVD